jgi:hypothetical protein
MGRLLHKVFVVIRAKPDDWIEFREKETHLPTHRTKTSRIVNVRSEDVCANSSCAFQEQSVFWALLCTRLALRLRYDDKHYVNCDRGPRRTRNGLRPQLLAGGGIYMQFEKGKPPETPPYRAA